MVQEIVYQDILEAFENKGLPIDQTKLYLTDNIQRENMFSEIEGLYIPRDLNGIIRDDSDEEVRRRYVHELGHGIFCENFPLGQTLVQLDRAVAENERPLYGTAPTGNFVSLPAKVDDTIKISKENAEDIAQTGLEEADRYYLVNNEKFEEYVEARSKLSSFYNQNIALFEGFSLLAEREIFGEVPGLRERAKIQRKAYNEVKELGIEELSKELKAE